MTTTPSTASQAPAVSISETEEFVTLKDALIRAGVESTISGASCDVQLYLAAEDAFIDFLDAKLAQASQRADITEAIVKDKIETIALYRQELKGLDIRATAAEAKLEAIRQGVGGIERYEHWDAWGASGTSKAADGDYVKRDDVLALLQPQHQANKSGLPG